ncbi:serine/threonine protein kinase, CMGC [Thecaphora frezii]
MGSVMTEDEEDLEDYSKCGYHPVHIGDTFSDGHYLIMRKLGWGHFSTIWLAKDHKMNWLIALKVVKLVPHYTKTALDKIKLLQRPVLGKNLLGLIKCYQHRGIPPHIIKQIAKQVLLGLDYMHWECGIIHTDLKPENVLICINNVKSIIEAELWTNPAAMPTKLVGVPPSQGHDGAQTPRCKGIFNTGLQLLPSPSSSLGSSPMFDKWAFGMSKIDKPIGSNSKGFKSSASSEVAGSKVSSLAMSKDGEKATESIGHGILQLSTQGGTTSSSSSSKPFSSKTTTVTPQQKGPSLLLQQVLLAAATASQKQPSPTPELAPLQQLSLGAAEVFLPQSPMSTDSPLAREQDAGSKPDQPAGGSGHQPALEAGDLLTLPLPLPYNPTSLEQITVKIADLGNACWMDHHFTNSIQTRQYWCPKVILGTKWGPSTDVWSASCMFFKLLMGNYLFDPAAGTKYNKDNNHVAQIIELLGNFPKSLTFASKYSTDIFNHREELQHIHKLQFWL